MCESFQLQPGQVGAWALIRTTVAAYVTAAVEEGRAGLFVKQGYLKVCKQV
jgi:hypothetical protein